MVYPITLEALSRPSLPAGGGASHVGVWEAVQRPRKAELEGWGGGETGLKTEPAGAGMEFPRKKFQLYRSPCSGCTLEHTFRKS